MKILRSLFFALIFGASLLWGLHLAAKRSPTSPKAIDTTLTREAQQPLNLLLIGIDGEKLEGVWLTVASPRSPQVDLLPVFPSLPGFNPLRDQLLAMSFTLTPEGEPGEVFWEILETRDILWHEYAIVDQEGIRGLAKALGMPEVDSLLPLPSWEADPPAAVKAQGALLQQFCAVFRSGTPPTSITEVIADLYPHLRTTMSAEAINAHWRVLNAFGANLRCQFPTLSPWNQEL